MLQALLEDSGHFEVRGPRGTPRCASAPRTAPTPRHLDAAVKLVKIVCTFHRNPFTRYKYYFDIKLYFRAKFH